MLLLLLLAALLPAPARADAAPAARELAASCDVQALARPAAVPALGYFASNLVRTCGGFKGYTFSARVLNPNNNEIGVYLGIGAEQCGTSFAPNDFPLFTWTSANYKKSTGPDLWVSNFACSDASNCCAQMFCLDTSGCSGATVSVAFVAPASTSTACGANNVAIDAFPNTEYRTSSCENLPKGSTQSLTLSNPNGHRVSLMLTDGAGSQNCGFTWGAGRTFKSYKSVQLSTATSFSFSGVPCESSPCCASISCESSGSPCIGLSYTQTFSSPSTLAAGVIAAIVIAVLAAVALAAYLRWRKVRKDQQMAMAMAGAGAPAVVQIQMNPVVPYGGAPPMAPYGGAPPMAPYGGAPPMAPFGGAPPPGQPMPPGHQPQQPTYVWT